MQNKNHIAFLDSIRGLAALAVINEHFVIAYGLPCKEMRCQRILDYSPLHIGWDGGAAVSMFFILSGLVLSLKYFRLSEIPALGSLQLTSYIIGRLFRIWLPYSVVVLVSIFLYQHTLEATALKTLLSPSDWINNLWRSHSLSYEDIASELFLLKLPSSIVLLPQGWTLSIELVISLLLPIGLVLVDRGINWLVIFTLILVLFLGVSPFLLHFLLGLMIARYYRRIVSYLIIRVWLRRLLFFVGLILYTLGNTIPKVFGENFIWIATGIGASLIIIYVISSIRMQGVLSVCGLRFIGKVSYSAYLIHMAVLICITPYLLSTLELLISNFNELWITGWFLTLVVVQFLSCVFYYSVELPSIRVGRWVINLINAKVNTGCIRL